MSKLQDCLGVLNDITTTDKLLHQLIKQSQDIEMNETLQIFANWSATNTFRFEENLNDNWRAFVSQKPFWN